MGSTQGCSGSPRVGTDRAVCRVGRQAVSGRCHLHRRFEADYAIEEEILGAGVSGAVRVARSLQSGQRFAVKRLEFPETSPATAAARQNEAEIFLALDHPHVVRLVDVYVSTSHCDLVMECMEGGELFERLVDRKVFTEREAARAVRQMLLAVSYLHSCGVVHRDLKPENFLYESEGGEHLKICDFGVSHVWAPTRAMSSVCGTLAYTAPEVLERSYTSQCDLWSVGVIAFGLLAGHLPFNGTEQHQSSCIKRGKYTMKEDIWERVSDSGVDFVQRLLVVDPSSRMTATEALAHPWISKHNPYRRGTPSVDRNTFKALRVYAQMSPFRRACLSTMAWSLSSGEIAKVRDTFTEINRSNSGSIQPWELREALVEKFQASEDTVDEIFAALDVSCDNEISYSEFLAAMCTSRIALKEDHLRDTFRRFDCDNSGCITLDSVKEMLGQSFEAVAGEGLLSKADMSDGISYNEFDAYLRDGSVSIWLRMREALANVVNRG